MTSSSKEDQQGLKAPTTLQRCQTMSLFQPEQTDQKLPAVKLDPSENLGTKLASMHLTPLEGGKPTFKSFCFHRECPLKSRSASDTNPTVVQAMQLKQDLKNQKYSLSEELDAYLKSPKEDMHSPICPVSQRVSEAASRFKDGLAKSRAPTKMLSPNTQGQPDARE